MMILKQSTAVDVLIGPFLDLTDGATAEEAESPSVLVSKNGQTLATKNDVTTPVHDDAGYYNCELDATDTNTVGTLVLVVEASANALPVRHEFQVIEEAIYDALYGASAGGFDANGRVDVALIEGSDATDQIRDAVVDDATRIDASALNTAAGAVGSDGSGLTEAGGTGDHLSAVPWNSAWDAEVESEANDALVALHLDHLLAADYDPASKPGTSTALLNELVESDGGVSRFTANALEAITDDDTQIDASALNTAAAAVGSDGSGLTEAGGTGDHLSAIPWNAAWDAEVQSEATDALNAYDPPTKAELDAGFAALNDPTAAAIADAVWDEAQVGHTTGGTFGEIAAEIALILADTNELQTDDVPGLIAALNDPTAATIAAAVWDAVQSSHTTGGSFGELATEIASILADTNELQSDDVPGLIAALNDLSAAEVNAEVVDALATDTYAEPTGVPGATVALAEKIGYLYMALRNQVDVTASKKTFYDDGGAAEWEKDLSDDGTTYSESEGNAI